MNKIYKVIWSKAKHTYVVASEIAKGHTKGETTGRGLKKLAAAMLVAAALLSPSFAWAADTVKVEPATDTASTTAVEVYTKEWAEKEISTLSTQIGTNATNIDTNTTNINGLTTRVNALESSKTDTALHISSSGDLIVGTKENQTVKDMEIRGKLTSGSISTGGITSTGDVTVTGKMAADGVTDETTKDGTYIKQNNTVGNNLVSLDKQVKANADAIAEKVNAADVYTKDETDQKVDAANTYTYRKVATEEKAREAADKALDDRITNVKEYLEKQTSDNYVSKADAAVQDGAIVKAANTIGENVTNLDAALAKETAARLGADAAQDKVIKQVNDNLVASVNTINKNVADGFTALNQADANEAAAREAKDNELNERITNEANGIHDEIKAGDKALDDRITNVKEYLEKQTSDTYVSKDDAAVQDGAIVKAAKTIGENVTNLDAALAKETAARLGADKAQDKVIEQVNQNMVDGFNTINTNMANGFAALNAADAAEKEARIGVDKKLAEAVNSGLSLRDDNVLQKNTTTVADDGTVTTSKSDANEMILNKGKDNQITLNEKGIKVGTNSTVVDKDGVYTGGDTYDAAKAAMSSDGQIKGANGKFTVDASGNTTVTSLDAGTGTIQTKGDLYAKDATFSGDITAKDATLSGDLSAKDGTFSGDLSAKDGTFSGDVSAKDVTATGTLQGAEVTDGTATLKQGKLTGVKDIETEALHVNGDANVTGKLTTKDLEVTGEFNANTLKSRLDENNYTEIHGGNVTSKNLKVDKGVTRTSESSFDENGREEYVTDNDSRATVKVGANEISQTLDDKGDNPEKAASRVLSQNTNNKYEITDSVVEGNQSNVENRTADTTDSQISFKDDSGKVLNKSYITQNLKKVLMGVEEGDNRTTIEQDANNITNTAKNGTITNDAGKLVNTASDTIANMAGNDITNTSTNGNIANTAANGTISNNAKYLTNTASENITNKAENGNISNIASNGTISNEAKTISNKADEALTNDAKTITNTASESVTTQIGDGSEVQSVMNGGGIANKATGKSITNDAATITNTGTTSVTNQVGKNKVLVDTTHVQSAFGDTIYTTWDANGITNNAADKTVATNAKNIQNTATGDITNTAEKGTITNKAQNLVNDASVNMTTTVGGEMKTTVTGKVTEDYKSDLDTKVGGNETHYVKGNQTNTVSGNRTVNVKGTETENFNALETNVKTDQKTSVGGNQTTIVTGNQTNNVSGSKTETVKGSVTEKYGSQATTVDGDQSTNIGGNQTTVVAKDQTNTVSGKKTETVKGAVNETYGSQTTKVNGDQSTTVTGKQTNSITGDQVNTIGGNLIDTIMGTSTTTVTGKVTEDYKSDLSTKVGGDETHAVTGNQTTMVSGNRTVNVKGTETENFNALVTSIKTDQKTSVGGNQTNIVGGDQQNTVSGSKTETVKGSVTEKYGSQATTVDGDQSTNIGGNQTTVVAKDQTNTVSGNKTETVKGAVNETYGSQTTKVNGDQSTTVTGKQTNSITGDQVNTIGGNQTTTVTGKVTEDYKSDLDTKVGGNQTTTVTGDSSLSAKNITNTASEKIANQIGDGSAVKSEMTADGITNTAEGGTIYNKSKDILNEVSGDILNFADGEIGNSANKITNLTGDNTVTSDTNGTTFENKAHSKAIEEGSVTKTTISGNTLETGKATMDYAEVMKDLGVHGNATVDKKLTVKGDSDLQGNATVGKDLEVKGSTKLDGTLKVVGKSTFKDDVTMEKNLDVKGTTTTDKLVVNNGATVTGGTTTDTLKVTGSSEFDGKATFNDIVTMNKGLSVTGGVTADTVTAYSYKVGDKTYIDKDGINANNQVIRNVGQGNISEGSTDAVSGGQLYETNTRVSGLETRMGTVETRVDKLDGKIDKVGANAAAMANLHPLEFDEDSKWNVAAAVGSSGSETASAVGVFYRPNENVMVNASAAMGTGENMFGGGVSLRLGHGGNKAKEAQMKAAAAENKELRAKVDDLTARMDALLSVLNPNMSKDFPDVPENHWAYEAVSRLAGNGIVEGYEDGKYHGERQMTRYEMAEIIYNALSKGAKAEKKLVEEFRPELQAMAAQKKA